MKNFIDKNEKLLKEIFNIKFIRTLILMLLATALFYIVFPKYQTYREEGESLCRFNKITGKAEELVFKKWEKAGHDPIF